MARIIHPEPLPGAQSFIGIDFIDGVAEVDLDSTSQFIFESLEQHGFTTEIDTVELDPIIDLTKLTLTELRDIADIEDVWYGPKTSKTDLVDALNLNRADLAPDFAIVVQPDGTVIGDGESLAALPTGD
jgi:hypothetical protein